MLADCLYGYIKFAISYNHIIIDLKAEKSSNPPSGEVKWSRSLSSLHWYCKSPMYLEVAVLCRFGNENIRNPISEGLFIC